MPVFFVLAIMGCGDDRLGCAEVRTDPVHYASVAQCRAALPAALARNTDLEYPVISGACRSNSLQMASARDPKRG